MNEARNLGDYILIKQIGQGALGAVYLAEHRFMKKHFALKILPEEIAKDRAFIQRFEEEVGFLAQLEHPNIVRMHNISYAEGVYFLVTDCIVDADGETTNLAQYMQSRQSLLSEDEIYDLLCQVAQALDYAHQMKRNGEPMVHRGMKLSNILVSKGESGVQLRLSDFGLTRIIGMGHFLTRTLETVAEAMGIAEGSSDKEKLTALHASFFQSYNFLAPEQKRVNRQEAVTFKSDAYTFGILAYFLLMGHFPEGYFEMPSQNKRMQYEWDRLILQCLQVDQEKRPVLLMDALEIVKVKEQAGVKNAVAETIIQQTAAPRPVIQTATIERPTLDPDPGAVFHVDSSVKQYTPEQKAIENIEPINTEMVVIQGGRYTRGSNDGNRDEMPRHEIELPSFAIDIHPVTNEQFVRFLEMMGGIKDSNHNDIIRVKDSRINSSAGKFSIESGYVKHPVVGVTWYGATAYAKWVGKRLPTEAEWEVAARGGEENYLYPTGDDIEKSQANFFSSDTLAVKSYAPNAYGLYDMAGNVYEWCYDWYGYNYYEVSIQEPYNPKGPLQGVYRVLRGGCWKSLKEDLRSSRRHRNNPGTVNGTYGFRCAADVQ